MTKTFLQRRQGPWYGTPSATSAHFIKVISCIQFSPTISRHPSASIHVPLTRSLIQVPPPSPYNQVPSLPLSASSIHPSPSIHVVPSMYLHARRSVDLSRSIYLRPSNPIPVPSSMSLHPSHCIQRRPSARQAHRGHGRVDG